MKRILAVIVLLINVLFYIPVEAVANNSAYENELLKMLGIIDITSLEKSITRGETAKIFGNFFGEITVTDKIIFEDVDKTNPYFSSINLLSEMGVLTGDESGRFYPEAKISCIDFVVAAIKIAGFSGLAQINGGYPNGYIDIARKYKLINSSVDLSSSVSMNLAEEIILNLLDMPYCKISGYSGQSGTYSASEDYTVIEHYFNVKKMTGTVVAVDNCYINTFSKVGNGRIAINDNKGLHIYRQNGEYGHFLGASIIYYVNQDESYIVHIDYKNKNEIQSIELNFYNIEAISSDRKIICYSENNRSKKIYLPTDVTIIYNGENDNTILPSNMMKHNVKLRAVNIDSDRDYEILYVNEFQVAVVSEYDVYDKTINDKLTNLPISFNEKDFSNGVKYYLNGEESDFSNIGYGDILTIYTNISNDKRTVFISKNVVEGRVTAFDAEEKFITVNETKYKILLDTSVVNINLNDYVKLGIDDEGYGITYERQLAESYEYAYLISLKQGKSDPDENIRLQLLRENGEVERLFTCQKFRVNGTKGTYAKLTAALSINSTEHQLIYIKLQDEQIKEIYTSPDVITQLSDTNDYSGFMLNYDCAIGSEMIFGSNIGSKFVAATDTKAFYVPIDDYGSLCLDEMYAGNWKQISFKKYTTPKMKVYDAKSNRIPGAVVVYGSAGKYDDYIAGGRMSKTNVFLVEKTGQCVDKYGDICEYVTGMFLAMPRTFYAPEGVSFSGLKRGDVIKPTWYRGDELYKYEKLLSLDSGTGSVLNWDYNYTATQIAINNNLYTSKKDISYLIGTVVEVGKTSGSVSASYQNTNTEKLSIVVRPDGSTSDSDLMTLPLESANKDEGGTYVYIYNIGGRSAKYVHYSDIELLRRRVFVFINSSLTKTLIIYE